MCQGLFASALLAVDVVAEIAIGAGVVEDSACAFVGSSHLHSLLLVLVDGADGHRNRRGNGPSSDSIDRIAQPCLSPSSCKSDSAMDRACTP